MSLNKRPLATRLSCGVFLILCLVANSHSIEKLKCACTGAYPPLNFMKGGQLAGIDVDQFNLVAQRLNIEVDLISMPFPRILIELEHGSLDCMFGAFITPHRKSYMDFTTEPIHVSSLVFFENIKSNIHFKVLADLKGLTIGLVRGFKTSPAFDKAAQQGLFNVEFVTDIEQNFQKLSFERLDLVLVNQHVAGYVMTRLKLTNVRQLSTPLSAQPAFITFSIAKKLSHLAPLFDAEMKKLKHDGSYQAIMDTYITE